MREVGLFEAKNKLSALVDRAEKGEEIVITRRGKAVARLSPAQGVFNRKTALAATSRIRERAKKSGIKFNWEEWKAYRDEGRR